MLEGLERVEWARLTDAYGSAEQVPEDIRRLVSPDAEVRKTALASLHGHICHQGSRYRASAPAVPFLFDMLQAPDTPDRELIIDLLVHLAVGYPDSHLPLGFDPAREFAAADRLGRKMDLGALRAAEPSEADDLEPGRVALWAKDAYEAVEAQAQVFRQLARGEGGVVRNAAVRALAWFPHAASESAPIVRKIAAGGGDPAVRANAILCLGILDRYLENQSDLPSLQRWLAPGQPAAVRAATAISLGVVCGKELPDDALELLLEMIQHRMGDKVAASLAGWTIFGPAGYAGALLTVIRPKPTGRVVEALCQAAETDDSPARAQVWVSLLSVVFRRRRPVRWMEDPTHPSGSRPSYLHPATLTRNQRRALLALGRNPIWERWESLCDHHVDVCMEFGLPWCRETYRAQYAAIEG